jgi:tetratricopeptide (TPR) repeat protein
LGYQPTIAIFASVTKLLRIRLAIVLLLLPFFGLARPQGEALPAIERALTHLELGSASLQTMQLKDLKLRSYYQMRILFLQHLIAEPSGFLERFVAHSKTALELLDALPEADPDKEWMMAEVFFMRGVLRAMHKQVVSSAVDMKSACDLVSNAHLKQPKRKDPLKLIGVFNVAMSAIPRKLQWLGNALCFKGDLDTGIRQLEQVAAGGAYLGDEAQVLLFYFEKNLLSRPDAALRRAQALRTRQPESKIFNYLLLSILLEIRDIDAAIRLGDEMEPRLRAQQNSEPLPIWSFNLGKAYFFRLDYPAAIQHFDRFLSTYRGSTLRADALYRKGMALTLSGRYPEAKQVFLKFAGLEGSLFDADEYARKQAAAYLLHEPGRTDKQLYAARNLFDGGYYQRSLDSLTPLQAAGAVLGENQRTELNYRLARNHHALNDIALASRHYEAAVLMQPTAALWMKVYSLYYLARIAEAAGDLEKAKALYRTALGFDGYPYQSGLEQRCKAALHQLKRGISSLPANGASSSGSSF